MATAQKPRKRMFVVGHIKPVRIPVPCAAGQHVGPLINTEKYDNHSEPFWKDHGECAACLSTVHISQVVGKVKDAA